MLNKFNNKKYVNIYSTTYLKNMEKYKTANSY